MESNIRHNCSSTFSHFLEKWNERRGYTKYWVMMAPDDKECFENGITQTGSDAEKKRLEVLKLGDLIFQENTRLK